MHRPLVCLAIAVAFYAFPAFGSDDAPKAADSSGTDAKPKKAECLLLVGLPKTTCKRGEKIIPEIVYKNQGGRDLTIWDSSFCLNHKIIVKDEAGNSPPLTAKGMGCRNAFAPAGGRDRNRPIVIAPGKSHRATAEVDVAIHYQLESGKQYALEVVYDDRQEPTPLTLTSKAVEFKVERGAIASRRAAPNTNHHDAVATTDLMKMGVGASRGHALAELPSEQKSWISWSTAGRPTLRTSSHVTRARSCSKET
ncbi:hypothetical protein BSF38_03621 [Paludisphaera borealis]|uniref:Uncharacterized protein n=2 Tax=Paludisphaera borealis TaxID=1387353 RepID=A0A1U7CT64_9BACT|nr:hypothetical protein BSF38_03621 [Paludisphaera borealis]